MERVTHDEQREGLVHVGHRPAAAHGQHILASVQPGEPDQPLRHVNWLGRAALCASPCGLKTCELDATTALLIASPESAALLRAQRTTRNSRCLLACNALQADHADLERRRPSACSRARANAG